MKRKSTSRGRPRRKKKKPMDRLLGITSTLRGENGCPWDRKQTLHSLKHCLVEETYEVIDAIDSGNRDLHAEELGDVLLLLVLQAQIRKEAGDFDFNDVINRLCEKLTRRHPHVFGNVKVSKPEEALRTWEGEKAKEKKAERKSVLDGVPRALPSLERASKLQTKASRVGFDWTKAKEVIVKIEEELSETRKAMSRGRKKEIKEELGDLLFAVTNLCRFLGVRAEEALEKTNIKFIRRFREMERRLGKKGKRPSDCSLQEMDRLWRSVKKREKS